VTEKAALAQDRHDLLGEDVESAGQKGRHDVEAVGGAVLEPGLDVARHTRIQPRGSQIAQELFRCVVKTHDGPPSLMANHHKLVQKGTGSRSFFAGSTEWCHHAAY